jgi:hypothetical protein
MMTMIQALKDGHKTTQVEIDAFGEFFHQNPEYDSTENGDQLVAYLRSTWKVKINAESLAVAKQKLVEAGLLKPISAAVRKLRAVTSNYPKEQLDAFTTWFGKQTTLVNDDDDQGRGNAANLLTELRGRAFSEKAAYDAIGRLQYSGKTLYFKPGPEADRRVVNDKKNYAAEATEPFMPKSEVRSSLDTSYEHNPLRHKADPKSTPEPVLDSTEARWKQMAQKLLRTGNSHSENDELQNAFNSHLGGSWRKTFEAMSEIKKDRMRRAAVGAR